ncbi:MAG TPA: PSD1 and planctomycete cytochrome C domain-containing protein [Lacipirellulaceae bacterium]|nr:PSD1 and planctomycete cytochrome C domain-containing protein [Lacipirellulaceae bacterium]
MGRDSPGQEMLSGSYYRANCTVGAIIIFLAGAGNQSARAGVPAKVDFAHTIVPILQSHCVECHGGRRHKGDFSINTRESILQAGAVEPGKSADSELIDLVTSDDADERMPKGKPPLSAGEIQSLRDWIDGGMTWESGFTFDVHDYEPPLRPRRPALPPVVDGRSNPIDRILDGYLQQHKVQRPAPLDDAAFLRRVYLDLIGLLPSPDTLQVFVTSKDPAKRRQVVDELLADKYGYAEHWLSFWNDLLRNDYTGTGYIDGGRESISRWLYRALVDDMPYDEFVRELIAPTKESEGFIKGIEWRGNVSASQKPELQFAQNVSQVFLGINMKCASCHDSFIDRWTLKQTYGLAAVCAKGPLEMYRCDKPIGKTAEAAWIFPELGQIDPKAPREKRLERLAQLMTDPQNGRFTRTIVNRLWHRLMGHGIVHPVDAMQTKPWDADLLDYLAVDLADHHYDLKSTLRLIVNSQAYQSQSVALDAQPSNATFVYMGPLPKRMTAEQFIDSLWEITDTGPTKPHKKVAAFLTADERSSHKTYRASLESSDLLMRSLGRPSREQVVTDRPAVVTTLEALDLSNSPILAETLNRGAENVLKRFDSQDKGAIIDWLYRFALSRRPTSDERSTAMELLAAPQRQQGVEDLLWGVLMLPEYQIIR